MSARTLEADYLVIGSGAAGMAFTDSLITETDAQATSIDYLFDRLDATGQLRRVDQGVRPTIVQGGHDRRL